MNGHIVEDVCWLCKAHNSHINVVELDVVIKGISMAVNWQFCQFSVMMDSATAVGWLESVIKHTHNVHTHALCELLIWC